ncbi:MAG TPA: SURF1 family protein [Casimicrobiaceae bacterium]|nr:SURF1 family protein [Casimicrobiaceae bacterium]
MKQGATPVRRRFRPSLLPTLGLLLLVAVTVALGNWQRQRAHDKQSLREQYEAASNAPPLALETGEAVTADPGKFRFRSVRARGTYDAARQLLIDNRVHAGRAGFDVVAPLKLEGAAYVLVDRGWVAQGASRAVLPQVPPPAGPVVVEGRINLPPARYLEFGAASDAGPIRENLDIARIAASSGLPLLPFIIEQTQDTGDGLVRDWPAPDFGIEQHQSYMVQWYSLAALGIVLWLALNWRMEKGDGEPSR